MDRWRTVRREWGALSFYQRFESVVALALTVLISVIVLVALFRLSASVLGGLLLGALDPLEPSVFQAVFGEILTLLIALEFNHTLKYAVAAHRSIIQTKVVLLIALLALARKFVILDTHETSAGQTAGPRRHYAGPGRDVLAIARARRPAGRCARNRHTCAGS